MKHIAIISGLALVLVGCGGKNTYIDGSRCECDSIVTEYYSEGNVWSEAPMVNGKVHGTKKVYYMTGNVLRVVEYQNDVENGTITDYTEDGVVSVTAHMVNGLIQE